MAKSIERAEQKAEHGTLRVVGKESMATIVLGMLRDTVSKKVAKVSFSNHRNGGLQLGVTGLYSEHGSRGPQCEGGLD
jgi:hypothetical protein